MSITNEKLQTIKDNVSKVYRSGQMDVIKNANSLKGFESNKAMLLDDVSPVEHEMEVKVRGKNILPLADSGIYYKGTIAGGAPIIYNSSFVTSNFNNIDVSTYMGVYAVIKLTEGKPYTLTINNLVNNCATKQIRLAVGFRSSESTIFDTSEKDGTYSDYNPSSFTFTVPNGYPYCIVGFYNYPTVSNDTVSFDAMQLELGSTATDYEPYNNDIQNVHSKNLIPYPYISSTQTVNGVTFTVNSDGTITANGTATSNAYLEITSVSTFYIPKGNYILSGCPSGGSSTTYSLIAVNGSGISYTKFRQDIGNGITLSSSGEYWIIRCQVMAGQTVENIVFKPQIELGTTATYYEKYHEPYPLVVKRCGKNLFSLANRTWANFGANAPTAVRNISKDNFYFKISANNYAVNSTTNYEIIDGNSIKITTNNAYGLGVPFHLIAGQQYTISCIKSDDIKCRINIGYYDIEGIYLSSKYAVSTFTMPENAYWVILCFVGFISSGTVEEELTFTNIQLELGTTATDYELYKECAEYTPNADGVINGVKNLYPNTTLISNGDRVYIDCSYYKDIDKAYNKLSAAIALSGGE